MKKIQMVDLNGQYLKLKVEIDSAIQSVIDSSAFIKGKSVGEFEHQLETYLGVAHAITCGNGTDALQLALLALGIGRGDEVITSDFTFAATAEAAAFIGAKPVLVDVDPETFTINIDDVQRKITSRTKAIVPVHLFGQAANMQQLCLLAQQHDIAIVEDNAQAFGAEYIFGNGESKKLGSIGSIGCTSFFPSKNLGCYGDGGAVFTNDDLLAERIRMFANHGTRRKYFHETIGMNSRLDSIQAAILLVKLQYIDQFNRSRQLAASKYDEFLADCANIQIPIRNRQSTHVFHQYSVRLTDAKNQEMQEYLKSKGVPSMIYYPHPLHECPAFIDNENCFDVSKSLSQSLISLPMHTELDTEQIEYIANVVKSYFK